MVSWATSDVFNRNLGWGGVRNVLIQTSGTSFSNVFYADSIQTFITNQICSNYFITKIKGEMYRALLPALGGMFFVCLLAYWSNEEAVNSEINYTQFDLFNRLFTSKIFYMNNSKREKSCPLMISQLQISYVRPPSSVMWHHPIYPIKICLRLARFK